jgi:hypothetical protein
MTLEQAMQTLANGREVYWMSLAYRLIIDKLGRAMVKCSTTGDCSLAIHYKEGFFAV